MKTKRGLSMPQEFTGWFLWGIIILIFIVLIILGLRGKLAENIDYFKGLLRFGRG
jgi:nitrogen fixation protein FixH